jgi:hypothetical protein
LIRPLRETGATVFASLAGHFTHGESIAAFDTLALMAAGIWPDIHGFSLHPRLSSQPR